MSQSTSDLIESLKSQPKSPKRNWSVVAQSLFWMAASFLVTFSMFRIFDLEIKAELFDEYPEMWLEVSALGLLTFMSALSAVVLGRPGRGGKLKWIPVFTVFVWAIAFGYVLGMGPSANYDAAWYSHLLTACFRGVIFFAIVPTALMFAIVRWGASTSLGWAAAMSAMAGAGVGSISVAVECVYRDPLHLLGAHVFPAVVVVGLGVWLGRKLIRW